MITGIEISKIEASRNADAVIMSMKFGINFDNVTAKQDIVDIGFTFLVTYEGESKTVGELKLVGKLRAKEAKKDLDEIVETWNSKKTLPIPYQESVVLPLLNFECGARGTLAAYSLGLLPPLQSPKVTLQESKK